MESPPGRLSSKPSWLITQLAVHVRRLVFDAFGEAGARGYHYRILAALQEYGPASQATLGRRCSMDRSDVTTALTELTAEGYAERAPDPAHRRRSMVTITPAGEAHLRRLDRALDAAQQELLTPLSAQERDALTAMLGKLLEHHNTTTPRHGARDR